ncbi:DNA-binding response regulator [Paenibacillus glucanolyticus]|jgi:DNA-binding NarL/FixJ family response regulator|uniref:response regulator n=1 Tax=Paenibacillus TaxID=44249 RepID=UPI0003E1F10D|nr:MULTISPECIES: response regulator transcription factor [Paenibacillus]ANA79753.1 DNA-binding response regulator [Paenibacillus glucanolyticus]AVV56224.1 DNA-binding response regulator [Paenibacillus glucanolyticus]ETT38953.1 LuxR family two component transcriptional regulator [Paenibacillus sp. FSL R5-808]MDH6674523.1 DNA-binding NarL/FixJ family response regulator [Paenibacillus sp. LBL]MPY20101.1 response regulator transcription factor [Paenibacillus glucanolyticus]
MISVLIVDDDPFIRESLKLLVGMDPDIEISGVAAHGEEALALLEGGLTADVILMDIRMPVCDGVEGTRRIRQQHPGTRVLVLTTFDDDDYIVEALRNGASGYLLKNIPPDRIIQGIKTVYDGNMLIHPDIARKLTGMLRPAPQSVSQSDVLGSLGLTPAEKNIVGLIAEGLSNKEIAGQLYLSEGTIKNYVTEILGKLNLRDRTQIAIFYLKKVQA